MACDAFKDWKVSNSLLWIYGKRTFPRPSSSLWLMNLYFYSWFGEERPQVRLTPQNRLAGIVDHPPVHLSSRSLTASLTRVQPTSLISSLISRTLENRMSTHYFLRSSSNSAINLLLCATSSLPAIRPTNLAPGNRVIAPLYNASKTCSDSQHRPQSILSSMRSMSAPTRLECRPHVTKSCHSSRSSSSRTFQTCTYVLQVDQRLTFGPPLNRWHRIGYLFMIRADKRKTSLTM